MMKFLLEAATLALVGARMVSSMPTRTTRTHSGISGVATDSDPCDLASRLVFREGMLSENFLGNRGNTDGKPANIRFNLVLPESGKDVDMVVTALSTYFGNSMATRTEGDSAAINVNAGSNVTLKFSFVEHEKSEPVKINPFYFTVSNLGLQEDLAGGSKSFHAKGGFVDYFVSGDPASNITVTETTEHLIDEDIVTTFFVSNHVGAAGDKHPSMVSDLSPKAIANSVTLQYPALSEFQLTLQVAEGVGNRDFFFGGASSLVCEPRATCANLTCPDFYTAKDDRHKIYCEGPVCSQDDVSTCCVPVTPNKCDTGSVLTFTSRTYDYGNLGGFNLSLPTGIMFRDVFSHSDEPIDLEITNMTAFSGSSDLSGGYLEISVHEDTAVSLAFQFLTRKRAPVTKLPNHFTLSVFDFDMQPNGRGVEMVEVKNFSKYTLTENTTIKTFQEGPSSAVFIATVPGNASDNALDPSNQTQAELDKTVTIDFNRTTTRFELVARVDGGNAGRKILLNGWSSMSCPQLGSFCSQYDCPTGWQVRPDPLLRCAKEKCDVSDFDRCCEPEPKGFCGNASRVQFVPGALTHNNLGNHGPDSQPHNMQLVDIFPQSDTLAQMKVSVMGAYHAIDPVSPNNGPKNSMEGAFLKIDVLCDSKVHLHLEIVDMSTNLLLPSTFALTVANMGFGTSGHAAQHVSVVDFEQYNVSANSSLEISSVTDSRGKQVVKFSGTRPTPWHNASMPQSSMELTPAQLSKSVSLVYKDKASVSLTLEVESGTGYRSFLIGGTSRLSCPTMAAHCHSMMCPDEYRLKPSAGTLMCLGTTCTVDDDRDTCCEQVGDATCDGANALSLTEDNLVLSNLGGYGPQKGSPALIFSNVFPGSGRHVDLEIVNKTPYYPHNQQHNGVIGGFGSISLGADSNTEFEFRLLDREEKQSKAVARDFEMSFLNLQAGMDPTTGMIDALPSIAVPEAQTFKLSDKSFVQHEGGVFSARAYADVPVPAQPHQLRINQLQGSVRLKMGVPTFHVKTNVSKGASGERRLLFTGPTNLACPFRAYCSSFKCPSDMTLTQTANSTPCAGAVCTDVDVPTCCRFVACESEAAMVFDNVLYSNLGGQGPDVAREDEMFRKDSIVYGDVFPYSGFNINLVITVRPESAYYPYNVVRNRDHNGYGIINVDTGSSVDLTFSFRDAVTNKPFKFTKFFFTLSGIDQQEEMGIETVKIWGAELHVVTPHSELAIEKDEEDGSLSFTSRIPGGHEGDKSHPMTWTGAILNHTATVLMPAVEHFHLQLSSTSGWTGRNFVFAGQSSLVCGRKESCTRMNCETGYQLRTDAAHRTCLGGRCYERDHENCCEVQVDSSPGNDDLLEPVATAVAAPPAEESE